MGMLSLYKILLKTTYDFYVVPAMDVEMKAKYFPPSKEDLILEGVRELNTKLDALTEEVAKLRMQPSRRAFIKHMDFYRQTVRPTIAQQCAKQEPNDALLNDLARQTLVQCNDLRADIAAAWDVLEDKKNSCDFVSRLLLVLLEDMYGLHIAMLSWARALYVRQADGQDRAELILADMQRVAREAPIKVVKATEELVAARTDKITFNLKIDSRETLKNHIPLTVFKKVNCLYKDTFSSTCAGDPFRNEAFDKSFIDEAGPWESIFRENSTQMRLAGNAGKASDYREQYGEHLRKVKHLCDVELTQPSAQFAEHWSSEIDKKETRELVAA